MPRRPLTEITGNRASNCELSSYQRAKIDRSRELGQRPKLIAETLNLPPSTVYYTLDKIDARNQGHSLPRSGRPPKWTEHDKRRIVRFVRINPKSTYEEIRQNLHIYLSSDTFGRILDTIGIKNWRAKKRPFLESIHITKRWKWAKIHSNWTSEWKLIIFSDECSVEQGAGGPRIWVFRTPNQK